MTPSDEPRLPADLEPIALRLAEHRVDIDAFRLDELKQTTLARARPRKPRRRGFVLARLATVLSTFVLVGTFGGALAMAQLDSHPNTNGGAADAQYTPSTSSHVTPTAATPITAASTSTLPFTGENVLTAFLIAVLLVATGMLVRPRARSRRRE